MAPTKTIKKAGAAPAAKKGAAVKAKVAKKDLKTKATKKEDLKKVNPTKKGEIKKKAIKKSAKKVAAPKKENAKTLTPEQKKANWFKGHKARVISDRARQAARRVHKTKNALRKKLAKRGIHLYKDGENPVADIKKQIKVVKREGGVLRYAKELKSLRKARSQQLIQQKRLDAKKAALKKTEGEGKDAKDTEGKDAKKTEGTVVKKSEGKKTVKSSRFNIGKVRVRSRYYTQLPMRSAPPKGSKRMRPGHPKLRKSFKPGTVVILLSGKFRGKKAVFLKQFRRSGLCLISGPRCLSNVPLRRMSQKYMIATSLRVDLPSKFKVPTHIDDFFFKRTKAKEDRKKNSTKADDTLFKKKRTEKPKIPAARKHAQKFIDGALLAAIKDHREKSVIKKYMRTPFRLIGDRYAHNLNF